MKIDVLDSIKNKKIKVGDFSEGVYKRKVNKNQFVRMYRGWSLDVDTFNILSILDCEKIIYQYKTSIMESQFCDWSTKARKFHVEGFEPKLVLSSNYWGTTK